MYDFLIVGAGLFGATMAERLANSGKKVLVIDKRDHIAGNCHTENIDGINVHKYGPHIFHTNCEEIWAYVNLFADFNNFVNRPKAMYDEELYSLPINLSTLNKLWGVNTPSEAKRYLEKVKVKIDNPQNLEEWAVSQVGVEIYEKFFYGYTKKQWGTEPKNLPSSILKRLPIRLNFNDNYFNDKYQGIPIGGYTQMIGNMLSHPNIEFKLNSPLEPGWEQIAKKLIYTGSLDLLFDYCFGDLKYRSLSFKTIKAKGDIQGNAIINYTEEYIPYTRQIEHKHFEMKECENSVLTREYPESWDRTKEAYYPVSDNESLEVYNKYKDLVNRNGNIIVGGRLGSYKYWDMDQTIGSALKTFKNIWL
jgi:UDP-galactopyranose mutase